MKAKNVLQSIGFACQGIGHTLCSERNMRIHFVIAVLALGAGIYLRLPAVEMAVLVIAITLVIVAEIFNSALETAIDLFTAEYSNQARVAKNLAAGAVLVTALNALIVGVLLFCPRIGAMLK